MKEYKYANRLIIAEEGIFLAHKSEIGEVVYNDGSYTTLYELDDKDVITRAGDTLTEADFEHGLYEEFDSSCDGKKEKLFFENYYDDDKKPYVKAGWEDYDHYLRLESEHGINTSYYDVTEAEIIEGKCFMAESYIEQDYPNTCHQNFFKFVAEDGREFYVKKTHPFFTDDYDYCYEFIEEEEFKEYE